MILLFPGNKSEKLDQMLDLLRDQQVFVIGPEDFEISINELLQKAHENKERDVQKVTGSISPEASNPFLFFEDASPEEAFEIEERLENAGLGPVMLAGKTENNQNWKLKDLLAEISQESQYMALFDEIASRLSRADPIRMNQDRAYGDLYIQAAMALKNEAPAEVLMHILAGMLDLEAASER